MEFLFSRWSTKSHTFVAAWGKFCPTLKDVVVVIGLPLFGEAITIKLLVDSDKIALDREGEKITQGEKLRGF